LNTIRLDITRDSKPGRELVENLLRAAHAPGAIVGRAKNGSAALLFRSLRPWATAPNIAGVNNQRNFELASKDGLTRIKISTESAATDGYKFERDVPLYELPVMSYASADVGERVINAAFAIGFTWAETVDRDLADATRLEKLKDDIAAGRVKLKSDEDRLAESDAEIVRSTEGREYVWTDGLAAQQILQARSRHAERTGKGLSERAAQLQAEEDRKLLARVERGELPDYLQRVIDARRRLAQMEGAAA
jgi:hypothetical protein